MTNFVWWATHAPMWQIYLTLVISIALIILMILPKEMGVFQMRRSHRKRSHSRNTTFRTCLNCGRRPRGNSKSKFCSDKCERRSYTKVVRENYTGRKWHRNRLFSQSNLCGICKEPIDKMKEATIDHRIPLSKGGLDTIDNMQLAHYECNQLKADNLMPGDVITPKGLYAL